MVKLINVDEGHIIGTISANTPISQFLDFVSSTTNTKCNMLVIFNVNGLVINESMPLSQQIPENTALYIFRKDKINLEPSIEKKDYTHFTRFPRMDYYNEPFPFADYDDFPAGYEKIPVIEKSLFELSQNAREFYAKFMVTFDYLDQTRKMQEIRLVACDILINNLKLYYNEVKNQWKSLSEKALDLQKHVTLIAGDFDVRKLENLGEPIDSLLQEAKFRKFDKDLHSRVNNFNSKVDEISVKVFKPIKESIRDVIESVEKVKFTTYSFFEVFDACEAIRKEPLFIEGLLACSKYTEFRDKLEKVVDVSHTPKRELANQLLSMESQVNFYRDSQVLLQRHLSDLIPLEKDMVDSVKRVRALYALKVIRMIVESAHKLKYRAKDKLIKFNEKYSNLAQQTEFLQVPMKLEEACLAARAEVNDSHERSQNANNVYGLLSKAIMENQTKREEFLQKYGHVLPRTTFPELIQPRIKAQNLASLLSFSDNQEAIEQYTKVELSTDEINTYYQAELLTLEKNYVARLKNAKAREEKLEKDMIALSHSLVKSAREKDCLVKMIKDFSVELNLCRNKGGERYAKNFQEELRKLREKEAAFKRMHMENLRALREENNRLKQELNGRIN